MIRSISSQILATAFVTVLRMGNFNVSRQCAALYVTLCDILIRHVPLLRRMRNEYTGKANARSSYVGGAAHAIFENQHILAHTVF